MKNHDKEKSTTPNDFIKFTKTQKEKLKTIFRKYHPQENDSSLKADDEYKKRLENMLGIKIE